MSDVDHNRTFDRALLAGVVLAVALLGASVFANRCQTRLMRTLVSESAFSSGIEQSLLEERLARSERIYRRASLWNGVVTSLGLVTVGLFALALQRHAHNRERIGALIAAQSERWRVTLESIGDAVVTTDERGRVMVLNPEAERLTGFTTAEAFELPIERVFRIVSEDDHAIVESPVERAIREGAVVGLTNHTLLISKDGVERPIDDCAAPIRDDAGAIAGVVLVFRDVAVARRRDRELQELARELSEANRRKSEFLAMLSHELRGPLAPIRNAVQILERAEDGDATTTAVAILQRQTAHLVRLVDDLLDVSRISSGKIKLRRARLDLRAIVRDAIESSRQLCAETGQSMVVDLPSEPVLIDGDATRLTQAIDNLIANACKYSEAGRQIRVSVRSEGEDAVLSVADQGLGIEPGQLDHIFDLFSQLDTSLERSRGGLGIGLTLVKQFVELHAGRVEAHSAGLGQGSEFILRLPLCQQASEAAVTEVDFRATAAAPLPARATSDGRGRRLSILVVDDNADSVTSLALLLRLLGYSSHSASDGESALTMAADLKPDVVLLDIGLPKLNGYEVARRLRAGPLGAALTLIALTGWGQEEDRALSREAGFDAHLVKPIDHHELEILLGRLAAAPV